MDTGLTVTGSGYKILLDPTSIVSGDTTTFKAYVDSDGNGSFTSGEKLAMAMVYTLTRDSKGMVTGYTTSVLLFDVPISNVGGAPAQVNDNLIERDTQLSITYSDYSKVPSGQNVYIGLKEPSGSSAGGTTSYDVLFTAGTAGQTVNTSTTGAGINNQSMDPGETLRVDFVKNLSVLGGKDLSTLAYAGHYLVNAAFFFVKQTSPTNVPAIVTISLADMSDVQGSSFATTAAQTVNISKVEIYSSTGALKSTVPATGGSASSLQVSVNAGDKIVAYGVSAFDRVLFQNTGTTNGFDIGAVGGIVKDGSSSLLAGPQIGDSVPTLATGISPTTTPIQVSEQTFGTAVTGSFTEALKSLVNFGKDGRAANPISGAALKMSSEGVSSGLFAVDPAVTNGKGAEILLYSNGSGGVYGAIGAAKYFTIDSSSAGSITLTQLKAIWHSDSTSGSEVLSLNAPAGSLKLTANAVDGDGSTLSGVSIDLSGSIFKFQDAAPTTGLAVANCTTTWSSSTAVNYSSPIVPGADGVGGFYASKVPAAFTLIDGRTVTSSVLSNTSTQMVIQGKDNFGNTVYNLTLGLTGYSFQVVQDLPYKRELLDFSAVSAGGPKETYTLKNVTFDGISYAGTTINDTTTKAVGFNAKTSFDPILLNPGSSDDINPNSIGFGVGNGNMDIGEAVKLFSTDKITGYGLSVNGNGGGIGAVTYHWQAFSGTTKVGEGSQAVDFRKTPTANVDLLVTGGKSFDSLYLWAEGLDSNDTYRINSISSFRTADNPDYQLGFGVGFLDGDKDKSPLSTITATIENGITGIQNPTIV